MTSEVAPAEALRKSERPATREVVPPRMATGTFKAELIEHQGPWRDVEQAEHAVVQWVGWYTTGWSHSSPDYLPPEEFEAAYYRSLATPNAAWKLTNRPLRNSGQLTAPGPRTP